MAEFVYITDDTYTKKQVLKMEHLVLKVLSFDLAAPTINQFLTQYFLNQSVNKQVESLAKVSAHKLAQLVGLCQTCGKEDFMFAASLSNLSVSVHWGAEPG